MSGISQSIPHPCNLVREELSDCQSNAKKLGYSLHTFQLKIKHNCISVNRNEISSVKTKSLKCWRAGKLEVPWEREREWISKAKAHRSSLDFGQLRSYT